MFVMLLTEPFLVPLILLIMWRDSRVSPRDLGLLGAGAWRAAIQGVWVTPPTLVVIISVNAAVRYLFGSERLHPALESLVDGSARTWVIVVANAIVVAPVVEELLFRGVLLAWLGHRIGAWPGLVVCGICFGLVHTIWPDQIPLSLLGMVLGILFLGTRSLWSSIALHSAFNAAMLALAVSQLGSR